MSFLGKIFSGKNNEKKKTCSEAIQDLRTMEDMLGKKQDFLEKKIDEEIVTAKKHGTKNKRGNKKVRVSHRLFYSMFFFLV